MTALRAEGLVVRRGEALILDEIGIAFEPGQLVGIVGPNAAGKSTLLRCLVGLVPPDRGVVTLSGSPLHSLGAAERARRIGYVPQAFTPVWDVTVRDVVEMGAARQPGSLAAWDRTVIEAELAGFLDRRWSRLSGGERARALLASVTIVDPPILLADEPGASLDIRHRLALLQRLRAYAAGRVVGIVLHDLDLALRFCDRIVVMDRGRIALDGAAREVARSPVLDRVFGVEFARVELDPGIGAALTIAR